MEILQSVKDALKENPDFKSKLVEELKAFDSEMVVTTKEENETNIKNQVKHLVDDEVGSAIRNLHTKSEEAISELLGVQKPDNLKGYEWYSEAIKSLLSEKEGLSKQINEKLTGDEVAKQQIEALKKQLEEKDLLISQKDSDNLSFIKQSKLNEVFGKLKYAEGLDGDLIKLKEQQVLSDLMSKAHLEGDALLFKDAEGKVLFNANNASNPYTASELVTEAMSKYLFTEKKVSGLNGKPEGVADMSSTASVYVASKAPKTQSEALDHLSVYMKDKGYSETHPEYIKESKEIFNKYSE